MRVTPYGAAGGEVTGSAYGIATDSARVLVDCGMFQGGRSADTLNRASGGVLGTPFDAVLLTHAHLDHVGRLPLLAKSGFRGPVYATPATIEMAGLILRDSARVQESDVARKNRKLQRAGKPLFQPLYGASEVEQILRQFRPAPYRKPVPVAPGMTATWLEAGHMLGSACIRVAARSGGEERRVVFSGDLGPLNAPLLKDFETFAEADAVFLESTYGDRDHRPFGDTVKEFVGIVRDAVANRGRILVPTFAIGRAQMLTFLLASMFREKKVPRFPVYLDSPMAIEAAAILARHPELLDEETHAFARSGNVKADLKTLKTTVTPEQSRRINDDPGPCLVMAGAGMCTGGRILHHLRHGLWKSSTHVVIVGYQSQGSLGRLLLEGAETVKIFGEPIRVNAQIHSLGGFSAHAGQTDLLKWLASLAASRPKVYLTHGEDRARAALASQIKTRFGLAARLPGLREAIEI